MDSEEALRSIEQFVRSARRPALLEPGEEVFSLTEGSYEIGLRGSRLTLQAWDETRNVVRRVVSVNAASAGRMELSVERFAKRPGPVFLLDLDRPAGAEMSRKGGRLVFRERFRLFLRKQFTDWKLEELSVEADLEHSLSPAYPRAFLKGGQRGWAAIAAPEESDAAGLLTFGLIWLAYLRERERRMAVEGLALYVPAGRERSTALRLLCLDPAAARFQLFSYTPDDIVTAVDPKDHGNIDTHLAMCRRPAAVPDEWREAVSLPDVDATPLIDGRVSLRVRGVEFAEITGELLRFGLGERRTAVARDMPEIGMLARELGRFRSPAGDRGHPLYRQFPEAWLEAMVRPRLDVIDATLRPEPVYGQAPAFAAADRAVIDLLACGQDGRLAVLELKASSDIQLPLQALDYWIRVKWHLDRGEFGPGGYFPGVALSSLPPRLLLVSPSLDFHSTTESILEFFAPEIDVVRIGLGIEWRKGLHVMFRLAGAQRP
jgi:hypothetical protein